MKRNGGIQGIILLAPGHFTNVKKFKERFVGDLEKADSMIASGSGNEKSEFGDINMEKRGSVYSILDPGEERIKDLIIKDVIHNNQTRFITSGAFTLPIRSWPRSTPGRPTTRSAGSRWWSRRATPSMP